MPRSTTSNAGRRHRRATPASASSAELVDDQISELEGVRR